MKLRVLPLALILAGVFLLTGCRDEPMPPQVAGLIRSTAEAETLPASIRDRKENARAWEALRRFYRQRGYEPAWSTVEGPLPQAEQFLQAAGQVAAAEGLDPHRYQSARLAGLVSQAAEQESLESSEAQRQLADLDIELTFNYLALAAHTAIGRIHPETLRITWENQARDVDLSRQLESALEKKEDFGASLGSLAPPDPRYGKLRNALARYRGIASRGGWPAVPAGLAKEARGPGVILLRKRLAAEGDLALPQDSEGSPEAALFDGAVATAVARFQKRHGLEPTGKLDKETLAELNVPVKQRIRQIELNLERWRWLPRSLGDRYILVNVPEYRMELIENGRKAVDMAVVVGKQQSQTPVFSDRMEYVELNPEWNIPPSIANEEIFPKLATDPGYLASHNMEIVGTDGNTRIRQLPGPDNPLGQIKFMFPNEFDVYLHDTPADHLFSRAERDFSHGCIRLERPVQLAEYLFKDDPKWSGTRIREAIVSGEQKTVKLPQKLPVHILYFTAWVEDNGTVQFREDIYGHDARLDTALSQEPVAPLDLPTLRGEVRAALP